MRVPCVWYLCGTSTIIVREKVTCHEKYTHARREIDTNNIYTIMTQTGSTVLVLCVMSKQPCYRLRVHVKKKNQMDHFSTQKYEQEIRSRFTYPNSALKISPRSPPD
ncbi:unnamed protein product [Prunus armeniaca]